MSQASHTRELYEALEKVAPELEALSREAESQRRPPEALAALLKQARVPMAKVPRELGGYEIPPSEHVDYFARIAYLNPTASWISFNQNGSAGLAGAILPDAGIERIFAEDSPLFAAVSAPTGKSTAVEGGFRVSGRWAYASGVHLAEWVLLMTICDKPAGPRFVVIPRDAVELHDDWHVAALQGTGSVDVLVDDLFVPAEMTETPLAGQRRGGAQYMKLGYRGYVGGENVGFSLGVAQRMLDEIARLAPKKKRVLDPTPVGDRGAFQVELGRTDAALRAARAYVMTELDRAMEIAERSDAPIGAAEMTRIGAAIGFATESICQAAARLFPYAGAGALHLSNPIQRCFRDVLGSGQHIVATNETLEHWGKALMAQQADDS
jgi:alkylation response protein AidB-like acyl-CoA dehydrogenase